MTWTAKYDLTKPVSGPGSPACRYCDTLYAHAAICPRVKSIEYYPDGAIKRVELLT